MSPYMVLLFDSPVLSYYIGLGMIIFAIMCIQLINFVLLSVYYTVVANYIFQADIP